MARLRCHWCGKITAKAKRHIDHVVPLAKGGSDNPHNLCCACPNCNLRKSAFMPQDFNSQYVMFA